MKRILILLLFGGGLFAQAPDCQFTVSFTAAGAGNNGPFQNVGTPAGGMPCVSWRMTWSAPSTLTGLSIELDGAPANAAGTGPGTFAAMTSTVLEGANPSTALATNPTMAVRQYAAWVQVSVGTFTGSGTLTARVYGYKGSDVAPFNITVTPSGGVTPVQPIGNNTVLSGQQAVTATAVNLGANAIRGVLVICDILNTIPVYVGPAGITTGTGGKCSPGATLSIPASNTSLVYVIASTTGANVSWIATN
jgi:hypothetical protein